MASSSSSPWCLAGYSVEPGLGLESVRLTTTQRTRYYGRAGDESCLVTVLTPWGLRVRCHRLVLNPFIDACNEASKVSRWVPQRIDSYAHRTVRGSRSTSLHSWGLAWDFFATEPGVVPPGGVWKPANTVTVDFARPFINRGFTWGATFSRQDWPHIEWAGPLPVVCAPEPDPTKEDDVALVDVLADPQGGIWALMADGTVRCFRGARNLGQPKGEDYWGPRVACQFEPNDRQGFDVLATSGERYSYPVA